MLKISTLVKMAHLITTKGPDFNEIWPIVKMRVLTLKANQGNPYCKRC